MHSLLKRQIKKYFGEEQAVPGSLEPFLAMINDAYEQSDIDREMLERSLEISSEEMRDAYLNLQALHEELEKRIQDRTAELFQANKLLQDEIAEHRQAEVMQEAVYRIAQAAEEIQSLNDLYPRIHQIISDVMPVRNFYIALYDGERDVLRFVYYVDEMDAAQPDEIHPGRGMSAYILRSGESLLCDQATFEELKRRGEIELLGPHSTIWLGVPLILHGRTIGVMAVQHYSDPNVYGETEQRVLEFVSTQVARAIERKRSEEELRTRETRYSALIENSVDNISLLSAEGQLLYENPTVIRPLGYPEGTFLGRNLLELIHPDDLDRAKKILGEILDRPGASHAWELRLRHVDGSWRWMEGTASNLLDEPAVHAIVLNYRDITERKQTQATIDRQNRILSALNETTPVLMGRLEINDVLQTIVVQAARMMDTPDGYLYLVEPDETALRVEIGIGIFEQYRGFPLKRGEGVAGKVWETGEPLVIDDYQTWTGRSKSFDTIPFHPVVGIPLKTGTRIMGVIGLSHRTSGRMFSEEDVEFLTRFAEFASIALENARLHTLIQHELTARTEAEANVRQFRTLLDQSNDAIYVIDSETGQYIDFNTRAYEFLGYTSSDLHRVPVWNVATHIPDLPVWKQRVELVRSRTDGLVFETFYRQKNGAVLPVEVSARMLSYAGKEYMLAVVRDITERRQAEAALRQITDNMQDIITQIGPDGTIHYASPSHKWVLGLDANEMIGHMVFERLHPDDLNDAFSILSQALEKGEKPDRITMRYQHADGRYLWMECVSSIIFNEYGEFAGAVLSSRDVTRRMEIESELRHSEHRYRLLAENAEDVIWVQDLDLHLTFISPSVKKLLGYTVEEAISSGIMHILTAQSSRQAKRLFSRSLMEAEKATPEQIKNTSRTIEVEVFRRDGSTVWTETQMSFLLDDRGKPVGILGVTRDITERRRVADELRQLNVELENRVTERTTDLMLEIAERRKAESALRESEERYALSVRGANDGLWDWNLKTNEIYFSPRWKSMLGFREEEFEDKLGEWMARVHPEDADQLQAALHSHLAGNAIHFESEYRIRNKQGTERWMLCRGLAVRDETGTAYRMAGSQTDITDRKKAEERLAHDAMHDALTNLPNRTLFLDRLGQRFEHSKRHKENLFAVLFIDIDRFKVINDSLGHEVGDKFLITTAQRLLSCLRPDDTIARLGGDEFAILLSEIRDVGDAIRVAERIQLRMMDTTLIGKINRSSTTSIGITVFNNNYTEPQEMLRDADSAMYRAKAQGGGRYQIFDVEMYENAVALLQLEAELKQAMENKEWLVYYQPIISLASGTIAGVEALVRWNHPGRGIVPPIEFITVAEESGLIVQIGEYVLREACRQVKHLRQTGHPGFWVSVNLSGRQFQDQNLLNTIEQILVEFDLPGDSLRLEVTETVAMKDIEYSARILRQIEKLGVHISLDDFGNGYSSFGYLRRFPFKSLKIERSFIRDMAVDTNSQAITSAIISLAHTLELDVVAEGVETEEQLNFLKSQICDEIQGFLFSRPLPFDELDLILKRTLHKPAGLPI